MFFRQIVPINAATRVACHMAPSDLDPDTEVESTDWESSTAYPKNTIVWYNGTPYISLKDLPDDAGNPVEADPDCWGWVLISF